MRHTAPILLTLFASTALAGPYIPAGDTALRSDIQRLADAGVITGPVTSWPLAWGPILDALNQTDLSKQTPAIIDIVNRVQRRADWETRTDELTFDAELGLSRNGARIRSFQNTPRGRAEASVGLNWTGASIAADVNVQVVDAYDDDQELRADDSLVGFVFGNWSISASTQNRWWGPGWDGSLILSDNARPFPALAIDRVFTNAFETKWLSWIGPWDFTALFGQLEKDRVVPNTRFFGMRFAFRPLHSLEIGISRTALWCGDGRPCDLKTFGDLLLGFDNTNKGGVSRSNEPGDQLAGIDFRLSRLFGTSIGFYGQFIGEDEAGGFPSRFIGQAGVDWSAFVRGYSIRVYAEYANTAAEVFNSEKHYNYAYDHGIYRTGYRYRGHVIGHGADNDSILTSLGLILENSAETKWYAVLRTGTLNDGGPPDPYNSLTPTPQDIASIDIAYSRAFEFGVIEAGVGYETIDDRVSAETTGESRFHLQWRSSY
jgi:Capsule assembly protein Wzi